MSESSDIRGTYADIPRSSRPKATKVAEGARRHQSKLALEACDVSIHVDQTTHVLLPKLLHR